MERHWPSRRVALLRVSGGGKDIATSTSLKSGCCDRSRTEEELTSERLRPVARKRCGPCGTQMAESCSTFRIAQTLVTKAARKMFGPQHRAALTLDACQTSLMAACCGLTFLTMVVRSSSSTTSQFGNSTLRTAKPRRSRSRVAELLLVQVSSDNGSPIRSANYNYRPTARRWLLSCVVKYLLLQPRMVAMRRAFQTVRRRSTRSPGRLTVVDSSTFRIEMASHICFSTTSAGTQRPNSLETRLTSRRRASPLTASRWHSYEARKSFVSWMSPQRLNG